MIVLVHEALDATALEAAVAGPDAGGVVVFQGVVRDTNDGRAVRYLEYEAFPEMALPMLEEIAAEAARRWPGTRLAIAHRLGRVEIGEPSVVIAAAAPHRAEAFAACRFAIDTLKRDVPIWKKEFWTDGSHWVEGPGTAAGLNATSTP
jgi:molybdopterin synthase catalytic subunit